MTAFTCAPCYPHLCRCPQPRGSMCMACAKAEDDCSHLAFADMPVIDKYADGTLVVRCTEFVRAS